MFGQRREKCVSKKADRIYVMPEAAKKKMQQAKKR